MRTLGWSILHRFHCNTNLFGKFWCIDYAIVTILIGKRKKILLWCSTKSKIPCDRKFSYIRIATHSNFLINRAGTWLQSICTFLKGSSEVSIAICLSLFKQTFLHWNVYRISGKLYSPPSDYITGIPPCRSRDFRWQ